MTYESDLKKFNFLRKKPPKSDYFSTHFKDRCSDRNLPLTEVKVILKKGKIQGFISQEINDYKVLFEWNVEKDLNIYVNFPRNGGMRFKSVHLTPSGNRKRSS